MTKSKKQKAPPFPKTSKGPLFHCRERAVVSLSRKGRCFIVEKFQIINIGEAVKLYQYFKSLFRNLEVFRKNFDKSRLKVGKIKMSEFQKMYVRVPGNRKHSFFIT